MGADIILNVPGDGYVNLWYRHIPNAMEALIRRYANLLLVRERPTMAGRTSADVWRLGAALRRTAER